MRECLELDFLYSSLWTQAASQMRVSLLKIETLGSIFSPETEAQGVHATSDKIHFYSCSIVNMRIVRCFLMFFYFVCSKIKISDF